MANKYREKQEVINSGDWDHMQRNFIKKVNAAHESAWALTERGLSYVAAPKLHR